VVRIIRKAERDTEASERKPKNHQSKVIRKARDKSLSSSEAPGKTKSDGFNQKDWPGQRRLLEGCGEGKLEILSMPSNGRKWWRGFDMNKEELKLQFLTQ